jgi:hypothetical protein
VLSNTGKVPSGLRFEHIAAAWGAIPGVRVVSLEADQIRSHAILFKGKMDILLFPYGSVYPMERKYCHNCKSQT